MFKYIGRSKLPSHKLRNLEQVLSQSPPKDSAEQLYNLYDIVVKSATSSTTSAEHSRAIPEDVADLQALLGCIYVSAGNRPLSANALSIILQRSGRNVDGDAIPGTLDLLRSVLFEDTEKNSAIRVHHLSFLDYIRARLDDGRFSRNLQQMHRLMFRGSLTIMNERLKFNICALEDASVLNEDVPELETRISASIPEELQYSSLFGLRHLFASGLGPSDEGVYSTISTFLNEKSLYWFEVMSLLKAIGQAVAISYECSRFFSVSHIYLHSIFANDKNAESAGHIIPCV